MSVVSALTGWLVAYLARWLPHRASTGLFAVGQPDKSSPVLVTANFSLTVKRIRQALRGQDLWLLVVNSEGINVWCAATGKIFTENRVIDAIKISGLSEKVSHREVILPHLSAPGVDRQAVKEETGFRCRFGPVSARDIPAYLDSGRKLTEPMKRFEFGPRHRVDMFLPMNFPVYAAVAIVLALVGPAHVLGFTALFWGAVSFLYIFLDVIPGRTGWGQAMLSALLLVTIWSGIDWFFLENPLAHWGWLLATFFIFFAAGLDIAGTLSPRISDAEHLMHRFGLKSFGSVFVEKEFGVIELDHTTCSGCMTCSNLCPVGVFDALNDEKKMTFKERDACFSCGACVKQCPEDSISLGRGQGSSQKNKTQ